METAFARPFSLEGEIALVTGGGTGLGLAITRCMVSAGAQVVITGRRPVVLDGAVSALGKNVTPIVGNITQLETLSLLIQQIETRVGPPSILVNNAGIHLKKSAIETSDQDFADMIRTHLAASFALARAAAKSQRTTLTAESDNSSSTTGRRRTAERSYPTRTRCRESGTSTSAIYATKRPSVVLTVRARI